MTDKTDLPAIINQLDDLEIIALQLDNLATLLQKHDINSYFDNDSSSLGGSLHLLFWCLKKLPEDIVNIRVNLHTAIAAK